MVSTATMRNSSRLVVLLKRRTTSNLACRSLTTAAQTGVGVFDKEDVLSLMGKVS